MLCKKRIEKKVLFGKVLNVQVFYIDMDFVPSSFISLDYCEYFSKVEDLDFAIADAKSSYIIWNDEPSIFWLAVAMIIYRTNAIFVPIYGWAFWDYSIGFYGSGYEYFKTK